MKFESQRGVRFAIAFLLVNIVGPIVFAIATKEWVALAGSAIFVAALIFIIGVSDFTIIKCDDAGVKSKNKSFSWEDVYMTVVFEYWGKGVISRLYLGNSYLENVGDRETRKEQNIHMDLTVKRLLYLLKYYNKPIKVLEEGNLSYLKGGLVFQKHLNIIEQHNSKFGFSQQAYAITDLNGGKIMKITRDANGKGCLITLLSLAIVFPLVCYMPSIAENNWQAVLFIEGMLVGLLLLCTVLGSYKQVCLSAEGVKTKKANYSWDDVVITVSVTKAKYKTAHYAFFASNSLETPQEFRSAGKQGMRVELDAKRLRYILAFYKKDFVIKNEEGLSSTLIYWLNQHNRKH